jgi:hypothetical protein
LQDFVHKNPAERFSVHFPSSMIREPTVG